MTRSPLRLALASALLAALTLAAPARAGDEDERCYQRALTWLVSQQRGNGGFGEGPGAAEGEVGITAIVLRSLAEAPAAARAKHATALSKAAAFLLAAQQPDGSFAQGRSGLLTYRTSVALSALAALDAKQHAAAIKEAAAFLSGAQLDEGEGVSPKDPRYGGFSYGKTAKGTQPAGADLSNTHMALAALRDAGLAADDPVFKRALTFLRRCQNDSEVNDGAGFQPGNDGGFVYDPLSGRGAKGKTPPSYAGMTYAGLLSLAYVGVDAEDKGVKAALAWIGRNYGLDANAGMAAKGSYRTSDQAGLYYYYFTFAKCLSTRGEGVLATKQGQRVWARDLFEALRRRQREDGSFVNRDPSWWEGNPVLVTAYSVSAMNFARPYLEGSRSD